MFGFFRKNKKISMKREILEKKDNIKTNNLNDVRNILSEGDEGDEVKKLQNMLMGIVHICPNIPIITLDGIYTSQTKNAVEIFQNVMGINRTGVVDSVTWERLKLIYSKKDEIKTIEKISFNSKTN